MLKSAFLIGVVLVMILAGVTVAQDSEPAASIVKTMRVPGGGIEPQIVVDETGVVHLIYVTGNPKAGDLMYSKSTDDGVSFSAPIRINSQPNSAIAVGSARGPHLAIGKGNRAHVAWNGSDAASQRGPKGETPVLYARMNDDGTAFEPQRNVVQKNFGIDGGSSVAADAEGNVYVVWHGASDGHDGEPHRRVWVSSSSDEGKSFGAERTAMPYSKGICACCGLRAFVDRQGTLYIQYRSSSEVVHRDMHLLVSADRAGKFTETKVQEWNVGQCVMSTSAFAEPVQTERDTVEATVVAAWETKGRVNFGVIDPTAHKPLQIIQPANQGNNGKHPVVAVNGDGRVLVAWTEGTSWGKGGEVAWQVYGRGNSPLLEKNGHCPDLPVWGTVAAFARRDGGFVIMY